MVDADPKGEEHHSSEVEVDRHIVDVDLGDLHHTGAVAEEGSSVDCLVADPVGSIHRLRLDWLLHLRRSATCQTIIKLRTTRILLVLVFIFVPHQILEIICQPFQAFHERHCG